MRIRASGGRRRDCRQSRRRRRVLAIRPAHRREPAPMTADYEKLVAAGDVWVGEKDGRVVGVLVIRPADDALELENVAVDPASRGSATAARSSRSPRARARARSRCGRAVHERGDGREPELYTRLGYVETGRRVEDGYRRVYFRKTLDARNYGVSLDNEDEPPDGTHRLHHPPTAARARHAVDHLGDHFRGDPGASR